jgi:hypothetical protein
MHLIMIHRVINHCMSNDVPNTKLRLSKILICQVAVLGYMTLIWQIRLLVSHRVPLHFRQK